MARDMPGPPVGSSPDGRPDVEGQGADLAGAGQPPGVVEAPPSVAAAAGPQPAPKPGKPRKLLYVTLPGCWGGLIAGCLSFTPSLLPRGGIVQGLIWGITAAIGYGLGVLAAWIWRAFADRNPRQPRRRSWLVFFITAAVLVAVSFGLGQYWQYEIRKLMGVTEYNVALVVASPLVAALIFCLLLLIGRGLRGLYRWAATLLDRWIEARGPRGRLDPGGRPGAPGSLRPAAAGLRQRDEQRVLGARHEDRRGDTPAHHQPAFGRDRLAHPMGHAGLARPQLYRKGQSVSDIEKFTGQPAREPIRIYSGLASADDAEARAALAVRDLGGAGGFERKNLLVVTTTGSGWVDPALVDSFEYLTAATRRPWRSSTPTCRPGFPTWWTSPRPARRAGRC